MAPRSTAKSKAKSKPKSVAQSSQIQKSSSRPSRSARSTTLKAPAPPFTDMEILSAFDTYAITRSNLTDEDEAEAYEAEIDEDEDDAAMLRVADVRRCLRAIGLPPAPSDFFDDNQSFVSRDDFLALAQTLAESADDMDEGEEAYNEFDGASDGAEGDEDEEYGGRRSKQADEIDQAFALFLPQASRDNSVEGRITLADLKRVAASLKEKVDEKTLRIMIEEANGEMGKESVARGVSRADFEDVMRRAKVFS